jgi:glutamate dehydrogenase (NAD(P)+)
MLKPERVVYWTDPENTDATGWVVIDRTINDVAGGGIFMHAEATEQEVADVAHNMSHKFTVTDPQIGGAKAGIRFDHNHQDAREVLRRFILSHADLVRTTWVTAADLNTSDEFIQDVVVNDVGLTSCQAALAARIARTPGGRDRSEDLAKLMKYPADQHFPLVEACVGFGLAATIASVAGKGVSVAIQGFGAVGSSLAWYLTDRKLARVVAICDAEVALYDPEGIDVADLLETRQLHVERLTAEGARNTAARKMIPPLTAEQKTRYGVHERGAMDHAGFQTAFATHARADVYAPCAGRYLVTARAARELLEGLWSESSRRFLIAGANNPFGDDSGASADRDGAVLRELISGDVTVVPDWVANSGTAQFFHQSLARDFDLASPELANRVLESVAEPLLRFLSESAERQGDRSLYDACIDLAEERLQSPRLLPQGDT